MLSLREVEEAVIANLQEKAERLFIIKVSYENLMGMEREQNKSSPYLHAGHVPSTTRQTLTTPSVHKTAASSCQMDSLVSQALKARSVILLRIICPLGRPLQVSLSALLHSIVWYKERKTGREASNWKPFPS